MGGLLACVSCNLPAVRTDDDGYLRCATCGPAGGRALPERETSDVRATRSAADDARPVLEYRDTWSCIACGQKLDGRAVTVQLHADCAVGLYNPPARSGSGRYCWTPYGEIGVEIWAPDGQSIAIVNGPADARLRSLEADARHRERVGADVADQDARRLRTRRADAIAWARRIVDALNAVTGAEP